MELEKIFSDGDGVKRLIITPDIAKIWIERYKW